MKVSILERFLFICNENNTHVLKVQQRRLLWNVRIRTGMLAPSKPMAKLQLTSAGLEFPPRSPSSYRAQWHPWLGATPAYTFWTRHFPGSERHWQRASTNTPGQRLPWDLYGALVSNASRALIYIEISMPINMNDEDSYQVFDKIRHILICSTWALSFAVAVMCNMYCNKPSPLVYHHTIAGNLIRAVWEAATPPVRARSGVSGPVLPGTSGQGTCTLAGSVPLLRSGN